MKMKWTKKLWDWNERKPTKSTLISAEIAMKSNITGNKSARTESEEKQQQQNNLCEKHSLTRSSEMHHNYTINSIISVSIVGKAHLIVSAVHVINSHLVKKCVDTLNRHFIVKWRKNQEVKCSWSKSKIECRLFLYFPAIISWRRFKSIHYFAMPVDLLTGCGRSLHWMHGQLK